MIERAAVELLDDLDVVAEHLNGPYPEAVDLLRARLQGEDRARLELEALLRLEVEIRRVRVPPRVRTVLGDLDRLRGGK